MKKLALLLIVFTFTFINSFSQENEKIKIALDIQGIHNGKGQLIIRLYNANVNYPGNAFKTVKIELEPDTAGPFIIEDIAPGEYAIIVYQDKNMSEELEIGMMGPEEPLGYSNNASNPYGPAPFESAKMNFQEDSVITINLR
ncbi:DUF2141 domain-containing protein [Mangrovivirga sp. M17]|uniref:DUF2141 domain-containing protein n=1 Tax=Mangrovivirga halotolerans TaxID=2993936 RepID=A0ABT3RLW3_9BACT|nr:DUF2141 domain-containing protein [Mangrovivirga halotolerans]MCX2742799.1 DUF2141 domain-containing protein [Mangrovivirga halotolerans]